MRRKPATVIDRSAGRPYAVTWHCQPGPAYWPGNIVAIGKQPTESAFMEYEIQQLLQQTPGVLYSVKEVGRHIDRDQYKENPGWARPFLESLLRQRTIRVDENGHFYFPVRHKLGEIK